MKKRLLSALGSILHDRWSAPLIILCMFSLVFVSVSDKLYSGENSTLIFIFLGVSFLCLLGRWIYMVVRSLKSDPEQIENVDKEFNIKNKQGDATLFLTYAVLWALLWYLGSHNPVINCATAILVVFFVAAAVVALIRSAE